MSNVLGGDAVTRLRNEYLVLKTLTAAGVNCPAAIAFEADEDGAIEIQSFIDGVTLSALPPHEAMDHLEALSTALRRLHSVGFVHRDVKLANVLMRGGRVYLIDFELAARVGCSCPIPGGTPGYVAPEGVYAPASASADIYSFGATIVEAATGVSPSNVALADNRGRLIGLLNVLRQRGIGRLVARLTEAEPRRRLTLADAEKTLAHLRSQERVGLKHSPDRRRPSTRLRQFCRFAPIAAGLATRLYALDQPTGRVWRNAHIYSRHICQGLNIGSAGILLGLASLDTALGTALFEDDLYEGARWLANAPPYVAAHGLFTGNAGVALALGVISKRLGRGFFAEAARRRLAVAAGQDGHYDLFSGAAGVLWAGCLLSQIVQSEWPLKLVATQADKILTSAKTIGGVTCWAAPSPVFSASEEVHYGAAHGAAGIAMALAAWSRLTDCTRCGRTAEGTLEALLMVVKKRADKALPEGPDRPAWPIMHWCHGTAGLLWCALQSADDGTIVSRDMLAECADEIVSRPSLAGNATYCHGLAGNLEVMRMMHCAGIQVSGARQLRVMYSQALRLLYQRREGSGVWSSEHPRDITPDLWVGFLGPAVSLALEGVDACGAMLSRDWLKSCARPVRAVIQGRA